MVVAVARRPRPESMKRWFTDPRLAFHLLLSAYAVYAALFIFRTSFRVGGVRYFSLFDDAMISMRYAFNLVHGAGLVWNPGGERVEGYSNPGWVLLMAGAHLLPIPQSKVSVVIQLCGALFLLMSLVHVKAIAEALSRSAVPSWGAALMTAGYLPLANWGLQGTEVSALTLIITLATRRAIRALDARKFSVSLYLLLGLGTLIRLDMLVPALAMLLFLAAADRDNRIRHLVIGAAVLALVLLAQTAFRLAYYGEVLPNTYYLKMTGYPVAARIARGAAVTWLFISRVNPVAFLVPLTVLVWRRDRCVRLLFWLFGTQMLYSIYVGGDAWEWWGGSNRFVSIVMPLYFVLYAHGLYELVSRVVEKVRASAPRRIDPPRRLFLVVLCVAVANLNNIHDGALREWLLFERPLNVEANSKYVRTGLVVGRLTTPDARVGVVWAGATPYFADRPAIDLLGRSDARIAREDMHQPADLLTGFYPGHLKWNLAYSIGELEPDVVVPWFLTIPEQMPFAERYRHVDHDGIQLLLRRDSSKIRWSALPAAK